MFFKVDAASLILYNLLTLYNLFPHMNARVGFGRWSWILNSPQYHRLHHSALPEHHDCNFAALFPIFDVLCGAYRRPAAGEFPPTGLFDGFAPVGVWEMLIWPWRRVALSKPLRKGT
jgi:sterol desaturase/sphingolipid hydroxylase (fatty acid hydroxylase superfamily)